METENPENEGKEGEGIWGLGSSCRRNRRNELSLSLSFLENRGSTCNMPLVLR